MIFFTSSSYRNVRYRAIWSAKTFLQEETLALQCLFLNIFPEQSRPPGVMAQPASSLIRR